MRGEAGEHDVWWPLTAVPEADDRRRRRGRRRAWAASSPPSATSASARTGARFAWNFGHRGLVPDTGAGTWLLPRIIGVPDALRLLYSGEMVDAAGALGPRLRERGRARRVRPRPSEGDRNDVPADVADVEPPGEVPRPRGPGPRRPDRTCSTTSRRCRPASRATTTGKAWRPSSRSGRRASRGGSGLRWLGRSDGGSTGCGGGERGRRPTGQAARPDAVLEGEVGGGAVVAAGGPDRGPIGPGGRAVIGEPSAIPDAFRSPRPIGRGGVGPRAATARPDVAGRLGHQPAGSDPLGRLRPGLIGHAEAVEHHLGPDPPGREGDRRRAVRRQVVALRAGQAVHGHLGQVVEDRDPVVVGVVGEVPSVTSTTRPPGLSTSSGRRGCDVMTCVSMARRRMRRPVSMSSPSQHGPTSTRLHATPEAEGDVADLDRRVDTVRSTALSPDQYVPSVPVRARPCPSVPVRSSPCSSERQDARAAIADARRQAGRMPAGARPATIASQRSCAFGMVEAR